MAERVVALSPAISIASVSFLIVNLFKKYELFLILLAYLVANRPFGRVIYEIFEKGW